MEVEMKDALPGVRTNVGQETIATFINAHRICQLLCGDEEPGKYRPILECQIGHRGDVTAGNKQDMVGRLWVDVHKRHYILVLIHDFTGYLASCNLAEQAVLLHTTSSNYDCYSCALLLSTVEEVATSTDSTGACAVVTSASVDSPGVSTAGAGASSFVDSPGVSSVVAEASILSS